MDTLKEYTEMCKQAIEIQKDYEFKIDDFVSLDDITNKLIWLPRQDQLQEILIPFELPENCESLGTDYHNLAYHFGQWVLNKWGVAICYKTMEQLWLGFVMWKKYKKVWNNGRWIDSKK